jgi:anti-anti-sigma regulatory factor
MGIQKISEDVHLVELSSAGPKIAEELNTVNEMISEECACDVIIDFSKVELLNSWNISTLLALRSLLQDAGHQLVLYNVRIVTKCIFTVAGLRKVFVFANSQEAALEALQETQSASTIS